MTLDDLQHEIAAILTEIRGGAPVPETPVDLVEILDSLRFQEVLLLIEEYAGQQIPNAWLTEANFASVEALLATAERLRTGA